MVASAPTSRRRRGRDRASPARHDDVHATVGLHPHDASRLETSGTRSSSSLGDDRASSRSARPASTSTTSTRPATSRRPRSAAQIQLAHASRPRARDPLPRRVGRHVPRARATKASPTRTVFHCFTGGPDEARRCLDLGAYLSFSGIVSFKTRRRRARGRRARARSTACSSRPTPVPRAGAAPRQAQPARVGADVGRFIADLRGLDAAVVADATSTNTAVLFGL